jgi:hypothetical protein
MATIFRKNFAGRQTPPAEFIADTYIRCNFSQPEAVVDPLTGKRVGVPLFPGSRNTARRFIGCNLMNCDTPVGSLVENCLTCVVDEERLLQQIALDNGETVTRIRRKRHRVWGRYVHNEDGSKTLEEAPDP